MILRRRTVELLSSADVPAELRSTVDRVLVLGGFPCSAVATRRSASMVLAVGTSRATALRRLHTRVRSAEGAAAQWRGSVEPGSWWRPPHR